MAKNRDKVPFLTVDFNACAELLEAIDRADKDLKGATEEALEKSQAVMQRHLKVAAQDYAPGSGGRKGYSKGDMYKAIIENASVNWEGSYAWIPVGFNLKTQGGFHSIFVMYGTKVHGTPRMQKDMIVWNAIYGKLINQQVAMVQKGILEKRLGL